MVNNVSNKRCPECGSEMTYIREEKTFDGTVPGQYVCYECGHQENIL